MIYVIPQFYAKAKKLRAHVEALHSDVNSTNEKRFCWDLWKKHDDFYNLRTPANRYFPPKLFEDFENKLTMWGQKKLGIQGSEFIWLTSYVDNMFQNWHQDAPHGPFAFVYSLSPEKIKFKGGSTLIKSPQGLKKISCPFNQLTVFDPNQVHAVEKIRGVFDILDSRLVIHGWFQAPPLQLATELNPEDAETLISQVTEIAQNELALFPKTSGWLSISILWNHDGSVKEIEFPLCTLLRQKPFKYIQKKELSRLKAALAKTRLPHSCSTLSQLYMPLHLSQ